MHLATDTLTPAIATPVPQADATDLLRAYRFALGLAGDLPPSRSRRWRFLLPLLTALRPSWGLQRFAVEHVRRRVDTLTRAYCVRLALGEDDGNDAADREALERFAASLPPKLGAIRQALPLFAILVVAQLLVAWAGDLDNERQTFDQLAAVVNLDPSHASVAAKALVNASVAVLLDLAGVVILSTYVVLRPFVFGYRLKRMLFCEPDALLRSRARSPLGEAARRLAVHEHEVKLFSALGMPAPGEVGVDLRVKILPVVFFAVAGAYYMLDTPDRDIAFGWCCLAVFATRGLWLGRRWRRRNLIRNGLVASHARLEPLRPHSGP